MNDVHCHILPCLDDGSQNMEQTISMARFAVRDGIQTIVATPHYQVDGFRCDAHQVYESVKEVNRELEEQNIPLHILPGMEIHIYPRILEDLNAGRVLPLGWKGRYVLVELPFHNLVHQATRLFQEICLAGYVPIIPHPERNTYFQKRPELVHQLVSIGAVIQLNAASIAGRHGKAASKCAMELLYYGLAHLLASDAHDPINRPPQLSIIYETIGRSFNRDLSEWLMYNSQAVVRGEDICRGRPETPKRRRFF